MTLRASIVLRTGVVLTLSLCCALPDAAGQPAAPRALTPGVPVTRELASGQSHTYEIVLEAGEYTVVTVKQQYGVPVLSLTDPDGRDIVEWAARNVSIVAVARGRHVLQVAANKMSAPPGRYELTVDRPRPADARDIARASGDRFLSEAQSLMSQRSASANQEAIDKLTSALARFGQAEYRWGEALVAMRLGQAYVRSPNQMEKARDYLTQAVALARAIEDTSLEALSLFYLGNTYPALAERKRALEYYEQALTQFEVNGDLVNQSLVLTDQAAARSDLQEHQTAVEDYNRALSLARSVDDRAQVARIHNGLGITYQDLGDVPMALEHFSQALPLSRSTGNLQLEYMVMNNAGIAYKQLGDYRRALDSYQQSLVLVKKLGNRSNEAQLLNNIGNIYRAEGQSELSVASYEQALSMFRFLKAQPGEAMALNNMGAAYYQLGDYQKALDLHLQSREIRKRGGDRRGEASALNYAGVAWHKLGNTSKALESLRESLEIRRQTSDPQGEAETLLNIAIVERDSGSLEPSRTTLEAAMAITESFRARITDAGLRASYVGRVQETYASYVDVLMRLHAQSPEAGHDRVALQAAERTRARVLLESLVEARDDIHHGADPALLERERSLQQKIVTASEQLSRGLSGSAAAGQTGARKDLERLTAEYREVQAQIRTSGPRYAALTQPEPLTAARIQQEVLDDETVLLEFALGETQSWLWAVTTSAVISVALPAERDLEAAALSLYAELTARQPRGRELATAYAKRVAAADRRLGAQAMTVSRMLFGGIAEQLQGPWRDKRLVIVAAGALEYLPFGSLPLPTVAGQAVAKVPVPLITHHEIVGVPSASVLLTLRRERAARAPARRAVAVLADPVFEATDPRIGRAGRRLDAGATASRAPRSTPEPSYFATRTVQRIEDTRGGTAVARLPFSRDEANAIASLAGQKGALRAIDFDASRANALEGSLENYRIVHFATHGLIDAEQPELSGLILSLVDERGQPQDGLLRLPDIFNMTLKADLVVLSACQTALGKEIRGEGLVGLTRGFMYAGAPRVVASLWQVSDVATAELMKKFYAGMLQRRLPAAAALRAAQRELARDPRWSSPYFWAGFVLQGDWR